MTDVTRLIVMRFSGLLLRFLPANRVADQDFGHCLPNRIHRAGFIAFIAVPPNASHQSRGPARGRHNSSVNGCAPKP
ncbi:hypothetical protein [Streptomyces sp. NPDC093970]|uniref:hypothetical protein n=1 Tax=Streptomyces sp. NPDC093970 TaxID=3155076 RepID=UPI003438031A